MTPTADACAGVTVVIPTHDRPELRRALDSVVRQSHPGPIEVVVVFDGTDPVLPEVPARRAFTVRGMRNDRSPGAAGARNSGILAARHDLVAFLDDDDSWAATKLERQLGVLRRAPAALVIGSAMRVDDGSRRHVRLLPSERIDHADLLQSRLAALHTSSLLVRRNALLGELGLFDEDLPRGYCEDYDLLLRASALTPVLAVNEPLVDVAWQGSSYFLGQWAAYAAALERILAKHPDFATSRAGLGRLQGHIAFAHAASRHRRDGLRWAARALRHDPRVGRAWLAVLVSAGLVDPDRVVRVARRFGRGL